MVAPSLVETLVSIAIESVAVAGLGALVASSAYIATTATQSATEARALLHVEHLIDSAAARAGGGPGALTTKPRIDARPVVELPADLDYDGRIDPASKETTSIAISSNAAGPARLNLRIGRQSISIGPPLRPSAKIARGKVRYAERAPVIHWFSVPVAENQLLATARYQSGR